MLFFLTSLFMLILVLPLPTISKTEFQIVRWDASSQTCTPEVCDDAHLEDIPAYPNQIPDILLENRYLLDARRLSTCFQNKLIVYMGDSTSTETVSEIALLLGGIATTNPQATQEYISWGVWSLTNQKTSYIINNTNYPSVHVSWTTNRRNMTVSVPGKNFTIRQRFNGGGYDLQDNFVGISGMTAPDMQDELYCLLGEPLSGCRMPDIFIFQSGHHDVDKMSEYKLNLPILMRLFRRAKDRGTDVYWKSTPESEHAEIVAKLNMMAFYAAQKENIRFINMSIATIEFSDVVDVTKFTKFRPHIGLIANKGHNNLLYSSFMTQYLLRQVC